jgi:hypothetical protein
MSSHREAPEIAKDAVADSTDLYAFVSPDNPDTVTIIANYVPLQAPDGGPNFYEFGDDVLYAINIDNTGDGYADISYQFRFHNKITNPKTFLYNTGPITDLTDVTWNRRQFVTVTRVANGKTTTLGTNLPCPPCNIGPLSTPDYASLAAAAVHPLSGGGQVFAGQRAEGFFVDLGSIFDLAILSGRLSRTTWCSVWQTPVSAAWPPASTRRRASTCTRSPFSSPRPPCRSTGRHPRARALRRR